MFNQIDYNRRGFLAYYNDARELYKRLSDIDEPIYFEPPSWDNNNINKIYDAISIGLNTSKPMKDDIENEDSITYTNNKTKRLTAIFKIDRKNNMVTLVEIGIEFTHYAKKFFQ